MQLSQQCLTDLLQNMGYSIQLHEDSQQIYTSFKHDEYEYPIFVRLLTDNNLIQILTFVPCSLAETSLLDLSRFLHIVNKELDMPGFCLDEDTKTIFYRVVIPCLQHEVNPDLYQAYIKTSRNICETFGTVIQAIAMGIMTLEEVFKHKAAKMALDKTQAS